MEKEEDWDQCQDSGAGIENEVSPHDARNGAARPDRWDLRIPICQEMNQTSCDTAEEVESKIPDVAEPVFNVIAEDPKIEHIASEMEEPSMKEHRGKYGEQGVDRLVLLKGQQVMRDCTVCEGDLLLS